MTLAEDDDLCYEGPYVPLPISEPRVLFVKPDWENLMASAVDAAKLTKKKPKLTPFKHAPTLYHRWYLFNAWKHVEHILPKAGRQFLAEVEKDLWQEGDKEQLKKLHAAIISQVLVNNMPSAQPEERIERASTNENRVRDIYDAAREDGYLFNGTFDTSVMLHVLGTLVPNDMTSFSDMHRTALLSAGKYRADNGMNATMLNDIPPNVPWRQYFGRELTWLGKLREHMWPPLQCSYPGMVEDTVYWLATSLAKGADCAFALADALEEGLCAGDMKYVRLAKAHFRKQPYHPLGCKYLTSLLDRSNVKGKTNDQADAD